MYFSHVGSSISDKPFQEKKIFHTGKIPKKKGFILPPLLCSTVHLIFGPHSFFISPVWRPYVICPGGEMF
jgi:hypothetical protein